MLREGFPDIRGQPPAEGAKIPVFLSTSPETEGTTGRYFEDSRSPGRSSPLTYNRDIQERLWKVAEEMAAGSLK
jgi:hypothetical protein